MTGYLLKALRLCMLAAGAMAAAAALAADKLPLDRIKLPPGFEISVYTDQVPNARAMALGEHGTLFVGSMRAGKVYAVRTRNGQAAETLTIATGLNLPVGVAFHAGVPGTTARTTRRRR